MNREYLKILVGKLQESVNSTNQSAITAEIEEILKTSDSLWYLDRIAFHEVSVSELVRVLAALLLKNKIAKIKNFSSNDQIILQKFVQDCGAAWFTIFPAVETEFLRKSLGGVIAAAASHCEVARMEILKRLVLNDEEAFSLYFSVLLQICEDCAVALTSAETELIVSAALHSSKCPMKRKALLLSQFSADQIFALHSPSQLVPFFQLNPVSSDEETDLCVSELLLQLAQHKDRCEPVAFAYWLPYYFKYASLSHALLEALSEYVDVEFCFFQEFLKLQPDLFVSLLSCLLDRCVLVDENELCSAMEDLSVPDRVTEGDQFMHPDDSDDSDAEEGQLFDDDEPDSLDSIRNCSLAILQVLTLCCPRTDLCTLMLPLLLDRIESSNWLIREASLMVTSICTELKGSRAFAGQLPNILQFALANCESHPHPLVRSASITCLGNYAEWIIKFHQNFPHKSNLLQIKNALLNSLRDQNKRVQEASCRAILQFVREKESFEADSLLPALFWCLNRFQLRNRRLVYGIIQEVADSIDSLLWPQIHEILVERFDNVSIQDASVFPLIGALSVLQEKVSFSPNLFAKACALTLNSLQTVDFSETFLRAGLDMLDSITEAHQSLVILQAPLLVTILQETFCKATETETLQSVFALFGDLIGDSFSIPDSLLSAYQRALEQNCLPSSLFPNEEERLVSMTTASNAVWSFGLLCLHAKPSEFPHFVPFVQAVQMLLLSVLERKPRIPLGSSIYFENLAIVLGRSAGVSSLSNHPMRNRILQILSRIEDEEERQSAQKFL